MDKISALLAEAKPLYLKKQREKKAVLGLALMAVFFIGAQNVFFPKKIAFDEGAFDVYVQALYDSDYAVYDDACDDDGVIPLDEYGFYEV